MYRKKLGNINESIIKQISFIILQNEVSTVHSFREIDSDRYVHLPDSLRGLYANHIFDIIAAIGRRFTLYGTYEKQLMIEISLSTYIICTSVYVWETRIPLAHGHHLNKAPYRTVP